MKNIFKKSLFMIMLAATLALGITSTSVYANEGLTVQNINETQSEKPKPVINIKKKKLTVKKGKKVRLTYKYKNTRKSQIKWTSSNKKVAVVNSKGKVKVKSGGTAVITAQVKGTDIKDTIKIVGKDYYTMRVRTTGYCNCRSCAGKWAGARTASGKRPRARHTIAVDRRVIKFGTKVKIGNTTYVAEDIGGAIKGNRIDIYYSSHRKANAHGVKYQTAKVYY